MLGPTSIVKHFQLHQLNGPAWAAKLECGYGVSVLADSFEFGWERCEELGCKMVGGDHVVVNMNDKVNVFSPLTRVWTQQISCSASYYGIVDA